MDEQAILKDRVSAILGLGSGSSIVSAASLAVICLFYVYTAGTYLQVRIYPLIDRVTYYTNFDFYIINEYADHIIIGSLLVLWLAFSFKKSNASYIAIGLFSAFFVAAGVTNYDPALDGIALAALPAIIALAAYNWHSQKKILQKQHYTLEINYLAIIGIVIGLVSLAFAITSIIIVSNDTGLPVRSYAYDIFLLFSGLSPVLSLLLIMCFPVKLLIDFVMSNKMSTKLNFAIDEGQKMPTITKVICLSLFITLSIVIAIIPHLPTVNADGKQIGVDTGYYVNWISALNNARSAQDFLYQAFVDQGRQGDRPTSLIFLFTLYKVSGVDMFYVAEYVPLILGPALVLAVYFLTHELTSNDRISLLAAFLTAISFQVLVGIYAGFYANWIALICGYVSFVFLFRFLKKGGAANLGLFATLFILTLFSHVYTWTILTIAAGVFLAVVLLKIRQYNRRNAALLLIVLLSTVVIDVVRTSLTGSSGGIEEDIEVAVRLAGPDQFALRWSNLTYATTVFLGGIFANFVVLGLGLYWLFRTNMKEPTSIFLIVFLSVGILPFLFGEWVIQTRTFYNVPFQIPAAIALFHIARRQTEGRLIRVLPLYLWLIAMAVITVSNFYLVVPEQ